MFINDIEFIDPLSQKDLQSNSTIKGGASAYASTEADADDGEVYASAYVKATGKRSRGIAKTRVKLGSKKKNNKAGKGYDVGYSIAYGVAYGLDDDGWIVKDSSTSVSIL